MVKIISTLLICLFFIYAGCKEKIISPNSDNPSQSSRDYIWKTDTLNLSPFESLSDLWGASPEDVWSVGSAGIWHYDGKGWEKYGHYSGISFYSIYGFSSTNIWATTSDAGRIYHYDGSNWGLYQEFNFPEYSVTSIEDIWGDSPNNIYAVGTLYKTNGSSKGMILKYDGAKWNLLNIPNIQARFNKIVKDYNGSGNYYLAGVNIIYDTTSNPVTINGFVEKNYEYDGNTNIREIFSSKSESRSINDVGGKTYFTSSVGNTIWSYNGNQYVVWKDISPNNISIGLIWGRNDNDIFIRASLSENYDKSILIHYNGIDIQSLYEADIFNVCLILDKDVFIITEGRGIARGTLISKK